MPLVEAVPRVTLAESAEAPSPAEGVPAVEAFDGLLEAAVGAWAGFGATSIDVLIEAGYAGRARL